MNNIDKQSVAFDNSGSVLQNNAIIVTFWGTTLQVQLAFVQNTSDQLGKVKARLKTTSANWADSSFVDLL